MKKTHVLLICSAGASSGFLAQSIRKAAKKKGLDMEVQAKSEAMLESLIQDQDILLISPHLKFAEAKIIETANAHHVPYAVLTKEIYGALDGEAGLQVILDVLK